MAKATSTVPDKVTAALMKNKHVVSAGMVVFGVLAAGSYARRKRRTGRARP